MVNLTPKDVQAPIATAPPEVKQIIHQVLEIEKDRLDRNDRGLVNADILRTRYAPSGRGGGMAAKVGVGGC